jgi:hypothetical protein
MACDSFDKQQGIIMSVIETAEVVNFVFGQVWSYSLIGS